MTKPSTREILPQHSEGPQPRRRNVYDYDVSSPSRGIGSRQRRHPFRKKRGCHALQLFTDGGVIVIHHLCPESSFHPRRIVCRVAPRAIAQRRARQCRARCRPESQRSSAPATLHRAATNCFNVAWFAKTVTKCSSNSRVTGRTGGRPSQTPQRARDHARP